MYEYYSNFVVCLVGMSEYHKYSCKKSFCQPNMLSFLISVPSVLLLVIWSKMLSSFKKDFEGHLYLVQELAVCFHV